MAKRWIVALMRLVGRNSITLFGASLTTVSGLAILIFLLLGLMGEADSPYIAVLALMVLPAFFVLGLLLIPLGAWLRRKRMAEGRRDVSRYPRIDFNKAGVRRSALVAAVLTMANLIVISVISYEGVHYTESNEFCGEVCHTVMEPQYTAFLDSPHANGDCVACHIGPGVPWFIRAKVSGMQQVLEVATNSYPRPVPAPHDMRGAEGTCLQCHSPANDFGDTLRVIRSFSDDEANTPLSTVLTMHVGGGANKAGIHGYHAAPERRMRYLGGEGDLTIEYVQVAEPDGTVLKFFADNSELSPEDIVEEELRDFDCMGCHNRSGHDFLSAGRAVDRALAAGRIDSSLPYAKAAGAAVLEKAVGEWAPPSELPQRLAAFYEENHPDVHSSHEQAIKAAGEELASLYQRNVFPEMRVSWGTYPNFIGHTETDGCFRCHDGAHSTRDGEQAIDADCSKCHEMLAWEEEDPQILKDLAISH